MTVDVFEDGYSGSYDRFYADKDYEGETEFLENVFRRFGVGPVRSILDLGCGTGGHALALARRGYDVTGVDRSEAMLGVARSKLALLPGSVHPPTFERADVRRVDLNRRVDAVIAMFAVMGYMVTNEDLRQALESARRHLDTDGLLVFDTWYGPAVITDRPTERFRIVTNGDSRIVRLARPELRVASQTVDVHYTVIVIEGERFARETRETHRMRFLFPQEVAHHLTTAGFELVRLCPFMRLDDEMTERDWNFAAVAKAV